MEEMMDRFERFSLAISEISRYWHKLTSEEMEKYGLKGPHSVYLLTLNRYPDGLTATQLCEYCAKDKADVSRMMAIMEEKGLVRKEGANSYRGVFRLTEAGASAAAYVRQRAGLAVQMAGKDLTDETRTVFYAALASITENLRILSKDGLPQG